MVAHVFVADLEAPVADDADRHHLERVLRLRPGEVVTVSDGRGAVRRCVVGAGLTLDPAGPVETTSQPKPPVTVAFALPKGDRPEWVVQKLTEVGVDRIVPMVTARTVVRWDVERATRNIGRLRRVAREAAMQCRRPWLPDVTDLASFADVAGLGSSAALADGSGRPPSLDRPVVLVGPEGGWSDEERSRDLPVVALGSHVLRTETAAVAAAVLHCALRARLVAPSRDGSRVNPDV